MKIGDRGKHINSGPLELELVGWPYKDATDAAYRVTDGGYNGFDAGYVFFASRAGFKPRPKPAPAPALTHHGRYVGERGTHPMTGSAILEVISLSVFDEENVQLRFYGGEMHGQWFIANGAPFVPAAKDARCPECGAAVYDVFDHIDQECPEERDAS